MLKLSLELHCLKQRLVTHIRRR